MAGSIVDIANKGLTYLGANAITALTDDTVEGGPSIASMSKADNIAYATTRGILP